MWESEGGAWLEDEGASPTASRKGTVCNDALHNSSGCMGLVTRSLFFLQDWELAKVAVSCHMALDMLCHEMHEAW